MLQTLSILLLLALLIVLVLGLARRRDAKIQAPAPSSPLISAGDSKIYVQRNGAGPTLILLHGIGASSFTWRLIEPALAESFDVVNLDLPGFGRSSKDPALSYGLDAQSGRLLALLEELKVERAYLMGSSMGGALALWLARLQPERFPKVMALAPATSPERVWLKWQSYRWLLPAAPKLYSKRLVSHLYRRVVAQPELVTQETLEGYHAPFSDPNAVVTFLKATELLADPRLPAELAQITGPVCLAYGSGDKLVHSKELERLQEVLPNSKLHAHPGGHHLQEDDPDWVVELARDFFLKGSRRFDA